MKDRTRVRKKYLLVFCSAHTYTITFILVKREIAYYYYQSCQNNTTVGLREHKTITRVTKTHSPLELLFARTRGPCGVRVERRKTCTTLTLLCTLHLTIMCATRSIPGIDGDVSDRTVSRTSHTLQ
uniref:Uncharacterized protein n=1 Tax=Sipha flava TaxID=143950 RepID=A0A2S2QG00_9HEMI